MTLPPFTPDGLLPAGIHRSTLKEVEAVLAPADSSDRRRAVFHGVAAYLFHARATVGDGVCWLGGGFVSLTEPNDTALMVYRPYDRKLAVSAARGAASDLISLMDVAYSYPGTGGTMRERWPVSGLVDAFLADHATERTYQRALAIVVGPDGRATEHTKGFIELEVGAE